MARDEFGSDVACPTSQEEWAQLAKRLEIQLIQISERDTQLSSIPRKPDEFTCTWCPSAMMDESSESSQVPLGTHEPEVPIANRPGSEIKVPELCFIRFVFFFFKKNFCIVKDIFWEILSRMTKRFQWRAIFRPRTAAIGRRCTLRINLALTP